MDQKEPVQPEVGKTYINNGPTGHLRERHNLTPMLLTVTAIEPEDRQDRHIRGTIRAEDGIAERTYATSFHIFSTHWRPYVGG